MNNYLDCIVIGSGPAGLSSMVYLLNARKNCLCLSSSAPGGKLTEIFKIKNFPFESDTSGFSLASKLVKSVTSLGGKILNEQVVDLEKQDDLFKVVSKSNTYLTKSVILALGTKNGHYGYKGEEEFIGKGVSYCATCDGFFFKGKNIAIIGEGKEAEDAVSYLSPLVNKIYLISSSTTISSNINSVENIETILDEKVEEIKGDQFVKSIKLERKEIDVSGVFIFEENRPTTSFFSKLNIALKNGFIVTSSNGETSIKGIFAAGDCIEKNTRQILNASSEGMIAALSAIKYLK